LLKYLKTEFSSTYAENRTILVLIILKVIIMHLYINVKVMTVIKHD